MPREEVDNIPELEPEAYGFEGAALDEEIYIDGYLGLDSATPRRMLEILRRNYCGPIGVEFMHISNIEEKSWLQERFEGADKAIAFSSEGRRESFSLLGLHQSTLPEQILSSETSWSADSFPGHVDPVSPCSAFHE